MTSFSVARPVPVLPNAVQGAISRLPPSVHAVFARWPSVLLCLQAVAVLALFLVIDRLTEYKTVLTAEGYRQPILAVEIVTSIGAPLMAVLLVGAAVLYRFGHLSAAWTDMHGGKTLRWFVFALAALMAWPFTAYGYNFNYDQGHYWDRLLILLFLVLLWFRPAFIFPFFLLVFGVMWQLSEPMLGGSLIPHKLQVLHALVLFGAAFLLFAATGWHIGRVYVFMVCCLVGAAYWEAALAKIDINWLSSVGLSWIPIPSYAHGWLAQLDSGTIIAFSELLRLVEFPAVIAVLVLEAGCVLFLIHRKVSLALLVAVICFHFGVFVLFGFLFWTWIFLDAALLIVLWRDRHDPVFPVYGRASFVLSVPLILYGALWAHPPHLGWFDTKLAYTYRLEAIGASGTVYRLPASYFAPYEDAFTMTSFGYLPESHGMLVGPYGVTHFAGVAEAVNAATSADEIFELEKRMGTQRHDDARAERFYGFVRRYVANRNAAGTPMLDLHGPMQFWSQTPGEVPPDDDKIVTVIVKELTTFYDGQDIRTIRELELARLSVAAEPGPANGGTKPSP